jgi:hypothetical protein
MASWQFPSLLALRAANAATPRQQSGKHKLARPGNRPGIGAKKMMGPDLARQGQVLVLNKNWWKKYAGF